jgi:hypothetical protein
MVLCSWAACRVSCSRRRTAVGVTWHCKRAHRTATWHCSIYYLVLMDTTGDEGYNMLGATGKLIVPTVWQAVECCQHFADTTCVHVLAVVCLACMCGVACMQAPRACIHASGA